MRAMSEEKCGTKMDPCYLRETAKMIKELAGTNRLKRRKLWCYWLEQKIAFRELPLEERRRRLESRVNLD